MRTFAAAHNKTLAALGLFVVINGVLALVLAASHFDRFEACKHDKIYWTLNRYRTMAAAPDIVLMGSSLLQFVTYWGDADYLNREVNAMQHNRCAHLEDRLSKDLGVKVTSYSMGLGGMHASDASLITTAVVAKKKPALLIYFIAPRDLCDNFLSDPASTETFQRMSTISDASDVALASRYTLPRKFDAAVDVTLAKAVPLYSYRNELATMSERWCRGARAGLLEGTICAIDRKPPAPWQLGLEDRPFDLPDWAVVRPHDAKTMEKQDNCLCYCFSYQPFKPKHYYNQVMFLRRMLSAARQAGIKPVLVNMPVRSDNLTAMAPHFYDLYRGDLRTAALECGAELIDMNSEDAGLTDEDFRDSVHLNGSGSSKFVETLADRIGRTSLPQIIAAHKMLAPAGRVATSSFATGLSAKSQSAQIALTRHAALAAVH
jgi:hypothetical protein